VTEYEAAYETFLDEYLDGQGDPKAIFEKIYQLGHREAGQYIIHHGLRGSPSPYVVGQKINSNGAPFTLPRNATIVAVTQRLDGSYRADFRLDA